MPADFKVRGLVPTSAPRRARRTLEHRFDPNAKGVYYSRAIAFPPAAAPGWKF